MLTINQLNDYLQLAKEFCESIMFASFSQPSWKQFFDVFLEDIFLPIIALGFLLKIGFAIAAFINTPERSTQEMLQFAMQITSCACVLTAISLKIAKIPLTFGPYLFLSGISVAMINSLVDICKLLHGLKNASDQPAKQVIFKELSKNLLGFATKSAIFLTVLTGFFIPAGPVFSLLSALSASALIMYQVSQKIFDKFSSQPTEEQKSTAVDFESAEIINNLNGLAC